MVDVRIGSAADMMARSVDRSQPARCCAVVLRTASSKAKFGAAVCVAPTRAITSNHTAGRCRNASGDISVVCALPAMVDRMTLMRPRSWYCGTQHTARVPGPRPRSVALAATSYARLPWLMTTPFGVAVEPDVYCRKAGWSGVAGSCHATGPWPARSLSVRYQGSAGPRGAAVLERLGTAPRGPGPAYAP